VCKPHVTGSCSLFGLCFFGARSGPVDQQRLHICCASSHVLASVTLNRVFGESNVPARSSLSLERFDACVFHCFEAVLNSMRPLMFRG
jgi:hypothetical protein